MGMNTVCLCEKNTRFFWLTLCFPLLQYRCDSDGGTCLQVCGAAGKNVPPWAVHKVNH